jgi:hypothetical protein
MRAEETNESKSIWSSTSNVDSVEHLFKVVPTTGQYKIRVRFRQRANVTSQPYALSWWTVS